MLISLAVSTELYCTVKTEYFICPTSLNIALEWTSWNSCAELLLCSVVSDVQCLCFNTCNSSLPFVLQPEWELLHGEGCCSFPAAGEQSTGPESTSPPQTCRWEPQEHPEKPHTLLSKYFTQTVVSVSSDVLSILWQCICVMSSCAAFANTNTAADVCSWGVEDGGCLFDKHVPDV